MVHLHLKQPIRLIFKTICSPIYRRQNQPGESGNASGVDEHDEEKWVISAGRSIGALHLSSLIVMS